MKIQIQGLVVNIPGQISLEFIGACNRATVWFGCGWRS